MSDNDIISSDKRIYDMCNRYEKDNGNMSVRTIAKQQSCSHETISRKYRRYSEYLRYNDIYNALPYKLARHIINSVTRTFNREIKQNVRKKTEAYSRTTIGDVFKMTDRQLKRIPMMGPKRIYQFKESREKYLCKKL